MSKTRVVTVLYYSDPYPAHDRLRKGQPTDMLIPAMELTQQSTAARAGPDTDPRSQG